MTHTNLTDEQLIEGIESLERLLKESTADTRPEDIQSKFHALFNSLLDEAHFWKVVRDNAGNIQTWRLVDINPATERVWNRTRNEVIGKTTEEIFSPSVREQFLPIVTKVLKSNVRQTWGTYFSNTDEHLQMITFPLAGEYFISIGHDIGSIKLAQD